MRRIYTIVILLLPFESFAQDTPSIKQDSILNKIQLVSVKDSSTINLKDSLDQPSSYLQVGVGAGNKLYSSHNSFLNSQQASAIVALMPNVGYFHKSGFSFTATAFYISQNNKLGPLQYSLMPAFETNAKTKLDFSFSYTYYIETNKYSPYSSPIQNDFYTSLIDKKDGWLQPGIALGYSSGKSYQNYYLDTTINRIKRNIYDSSTNNLSAFTMVLSVQHGFKWVSLFDKSDKLDFNSVFLLNFGSDINNVTNNINFPNLINRLVKKGKVPKLKNSQTHFTLESLGLDLDASYEIGQFTIEPELIFDYYLPQTTANRFTYVYSIDVTYAF